MQQTQQQQEPEEEILISMEIKQERNFVCGRVVPLVEDSKFCTDNTLPEMITFLTGLALRSHNRNLTGNRRYEEDTSIGAETVSPSYHDTVYVVKRLVLSK